MKTLRTSAIVSALFAAAALATACSDGDVRYASLPAPGANAATPNAPPPPSAQGTDAGPSDPITPPCGSAGPEGETLRALPVAGQPPAPTAGEIVPGTYLLADLNDYPGFEKPTEGNDGGTSPSTSFVAKKTLVLTDKTFAFDEAEGDTTSGLGPATHSGGFYSVDGATIVLQRGCPDTASMRIQYSASGGVIALHRGAHIEIYQRQP